MADVKEKPSDVARAFEIAGALHAEALTKARDAALRYKTECDQFMTFMADSFRGLAETVQSHLDTVLVHTRKIQPLLDKVKQLDKERPATKRPVKSSCAKRRA